MTPGPVFKQPESRAKAKSPAPRLPPRSGDVCSPTIQDDYDFNKDRVKYMEDAACVSRVFARVASLRATSPRSFQRTVGELISRTILLFGLGTIKGSGFAPVTIA